MPYIFFFFIFRFVLNFSPPFPLPSPTHLFFFSLIGGNRMSVKKNLIKKGKERRRKKNTTTTTRINQHGLFFSRQGVQVRSIRVVRLWCWCDSNGWWPELDNMPDVLSSLECFLLFFFDFLNVDRLLANGSFGGEMQLKLNVTDPLTHPTSSASSFSSSSSYSSSFINFKSFETRHTPRPPVEQFATTKIHQ